MFVTGSGHNFTHGSLWEDEGAGKGREGRGKYLSGYRSTNNLKTWKRTEAAAGETIRERGERARRRKGQGGSDCVE